jgi:hypothetical protein
MNTEGGTRPALLLSDIGYTSGMGLTLFVQTRLVPEQEVS